MTCCLSLSLVVTDVDTRMFDVVLGTFLYDVELVNITFSSGVLTLAEANMRGFNIQEQRFQNGSKTFRLQVPFSDSFVVKTVSVQYNSVSFFPILVFAVSDLDLFHCSKLTCCSQFIVFTLPMVL